jgi:hypothetical protein
MSPGNCAVANAWASRATCLGFTSSAVHAGRGRLFRASWHSSCMPWRMPAPASPDSSTCHWYRGAVRIEGEDSAAAARAVLSWTGAGLRLNCLAQVAAERAAPASSPQVMAAPCCCTSSVACWHSCSSCFSCLSSGGLGVCFTLASRPVQRTNAATAGCLLPATSGSAAWLHGRARTAACWALGQGAQGWCGLQRQQKGAGMGQLHL